MQVRELIEKLKQFESDTEVYLYTWNNETKRAESKNLDSLQVSRIGWGGIFLLAEGWPECMVGGHGEGCMCNLGFTPRWRNKNE